MNLQHQTVMITGAAGHLGRAVAASFQQQGARLVLLDRNLAALQRMFEQVTEAVLLGVDLLDREQIRCGMQEALARWGRVHVVCHVAGGFRMGEAVHETSPQNWDFLTDLNARSFVNVASVVVPHLIEHGGGKIVTIGAAAGLKGMAQMGAYCASKSALIRLTESMSAELKDKNINVNCVLPSIIDTPDNRQAMPQADPSRWVAPDALGAVIAFLCSHEARAIHGAVIPVLGLS